MKVMSNSKNELIIEIGKIAACCRRGESSDAASKLNQFLLQLQIYLQSGVVEPNTLKKVSYSLETLLILQEQKDWVALADVLEYELVSFL